MAHDAHGPLTIQNIAAPVAGHVALRDVNIYAHQPASYSDHSSEQLHAMQASLQKRCSVINKRLWMGRDAMGVWGACAASLLLALLLLQALLVGASWAVLMTLMGAASVLLIGTAIFLVPFRRARSLDIRLLRRYENDLLQIELILWDREHH